MIASNYGLLLSLVLAAKPTTAADFVNKARCGDCWCIPDGDDTCPTDIVGITDTFSESDKLFSNFELINDKSDFLKLRSASGDVCYPFADTFNNVAFDNYPESGLEQCVFPDDNDDQVCGYVYDQTSPTCEGRKYRIQNFPSINDAMAGNAAILHQGGKMRCLDDRRARSALGDIVQFCGKVHFMERQFNRLVSDLLHFIPCYNFVIKQSLVLDE